jgi:hypothetical protein
MGSGNDRADLSSISEKQKDDSSARAAAPASNPVFLGSIGFSFGDLARRGGCDSMVARTGRAIGEALLVPVRDASDRIGVPYAGAALALPGLQIRSKRSEFSQMTLAAEQWLNSIDEIRFVAPIDIDQRRPIRTPRRSRGRSERLRSTVGGRLSYIDLSLFQIVQARVTPSPST